MKRACSRSRCLVLTIRLSTSLHSATNKNVTCPPPTRNPCQCSACNVSNATYCQVNKVCELLHCAAKQNYTQRHVWPSAAWAFTVYSGHRVQTWHAMTVMKLPETHLYVEIQWWVENLTDFFSWSQTAWKYSQRGINKPRLKTLKWKALISKAQQTENPSLFDVRICDRTNAVVLAWVRQRGENHFDRKNMMRPQAFLPSITAKHRRSIPNFLSRKKKNTTAQHLEGYVVLQPRLCEADSSISSLSAACQCNTKLKTERGGGWVRGRLF